MNVLGKKGSGDVYETSSSRAIKTFPRVFFVVFLLHSMICVSHPSEHHANLRNSRATLPTEDRTGGRYSAGTACPCPFTSNSPLETETPFLLLLGRNQPATALCWFWLLLIFGRKKVLHAEWFLVHFITMDFNIQNYLDIKVSYWCGG